MPGTNEHCYMTRNAAKLAGKCFPKELWTEYCCYPDLYFSEPNRLKKYHFETNGIQFHYPPTIDYSCLYRYWEVKNGKHVRYPFHNENYRHMIRGFNYYIRQVLHESKEECWKYAGCLVHVLQDSLIGVHSLENAEGFDIQALDRLGYFKKNPADILCECGHATDFEEITDYQPHVLGRNAQEFALNLYSRYIELGNSSRKASFQAIMAVHEKKDPKSVLENIRICFRNAVTLAADVLYTLRLLREKKAVLEFVPFSSLTDMVPIFFPFGGGGGSYRFSSYTKNFTFNKNRQKVPLTLWKNNQKLVFEKGFAFGIHLSGEMLFRLPDYGYSFFTSKVGLLPDCDQNENVKIDWINAGKTIQSLVFCGAGEMQTVKIDRPRGWFGVKMESSSARGVFVIGEPLLFP